VCGLSGLVGTFWVVVRFKRVPGTAEVKWERYRDNKVPATCLLLQEVYTIFVSSAGPLSARLFAMQSDALVSRTGNIKSVTLVVFQCLMCTGSLYAGWFGWVVRVGEWLHLCTGLCRAGGYYSRQCHACRMSCHSSLVC
jgi:hypothetical protein